MTKGKKAEPQLVKVKISQKAWQAVCAHAEKYHVSTEEVLDQITIDYLPMPNGPTRCGLCGEEGHNSKKCLNQLNFNIK